MSEITIERVDHIGIRVHDLDRAMRFYEALGFKLLQRITYDPVAIVKNAAGVEINLIVNANTGDPATNILMDVDGKYAGYTHVALRVASIPDTIAALKRHQIAITQGPSKFGDDGGDRCSCATPTATSSSCAAATKATSPARPSTRT